MTEVKKLVERLTESAAAFRKYPIFTADGDPVLLTVQADELEQAASTLQSQARRVEELEGAMDEAREIAKRVPQLEFELRAKDAELEIADGEIERLKAVEIELRKALVPEGYNDVAARSALPDPPGPCEGRGREGGEA